MNLATDPVRLLTAAALLLAYIALCVALATGRRRKRRATVADNANTAAHWIVAFASQTGTAEDLAGQTADTLRLAGVPVHLCSLSDLDADRLRRAERILFLVSTYGEGDQPDNAAAFVSRQMRAGLPLAQLHYAVLALGDSSYANFCGFGRALDSWLQAQGAQTLFDRVEVDRGASHAIETWQQHLSHLAGTSDAPDWSGPTFTDWRLAERRLLNPGSAGEPVYHIELEPIDAMLPAWQSGDLAQVAVPGGQERPREYSIASIAEDGRVHLLIRLHRHADGACGLASGWLCVQAAIGERIKLRLRQHRRFRLEDNRDRPLILIGNGTGMAGLRGHLKARVRSGVTRNWLIFGERNIAADFYYREEIDAWHASGTLQRLDPVFSRDQPQRRYVQDRLMELGDTLRDWVGQGAAIYVCGSLKGMAGGVDQALADLLGRDVLEQLFAAERYRRDVY
jgi:sulfite reductase (NADPH) flavoprotein alpha-component